MADDMTAMMMMESQSSFASGLEAGTASGSEAGIPTVQVEELQVLEGMASGPEAGTASGTEVDVHFSDVEQI